LLQKRRLAGPDLAGDHGDGRAGHDPVFEDREGALVRRRPVQEIGVGQKREGPFGQAEMLCEIIQSLTSIGLWNLGAGKSGQKMGRTLGENMATGR
jgi:hypothetical protein